MAKWLVELEGSDSSLQLLEESLSGYDPRVVCEDGKFYLSSKDLDELHHLGEVHTKAQHLVELLDRAACFHFGNIQPITIRGISKVRDDGSKQGVMFAGLTFHINVVAEASPTGSGTIVKTLQASKQHQAITDALKFFRKGDWSSLYKAYEIVRAEVGEKNIIQNGWLGRNSIRRFRHTAQSAEVLKDEARHAAGKCEPPKKPMSIQEARAVIGDLIQKWIESKETEATNT